MADENTNIQQPGEEVTPESLGVTFEDILPWGSEGGDTGLSARLKLKRNFEKIKMWFDLSETRFLSKAHEDSTAFLISFFGGIIADLMIQSPNFKLGEWSKDEDGEEHNDGEGFSIWKNAVDAWIMEIDYATVRHLLRAKELYTQTAHIGEVTNQTIFKVGLQTLGNILIGKYAEGVEGGIITPEGHVEINTLITRGLAKLQELFVVNDSTFGGSLSSIDFLSDFLGGKGWAIQKKTRINAEGVEEEYYVLEIDNVTVRNTLRVYEMVVSQLRGEFDNYVFAAMMEVHHYDAATGKVWLVPQRNQRAVSFTKGDYIKVQQYIPGNDVVSGGNGYIIKTYELIITDSGTGGMNDENGDRLDWVTFKNFVTDIEDGTPATVIAAKDTFVRLDNETDPERKGLMQIITVGPNTPYQDVCYGMKTDPNNSLKLRIGNLSGVRTDLFGWLEEYGAYLPNLYSVGKMFNRQTGESYNSSLEITRERLRSVYTETVFNISDEDNFLKNGFFANDMESWTTCAVGGGAAPSDLAQQTINSGDGTPLMVNGAILAYQNRLTAKVTEWSGMKVLHLLGMGIYQNFSDIKANDTHKENKSDNDQSDDYTQTKDVANRLYIGIRILPISSGTLKVTFMRSSGSVIAEWSKELNASHEWSLEQAMDSDASPWAYTGETGRMILSYTGECYIRFVALRTDPVVNSRETYETMIEQTSRRITLEAAKQTADLNREVARIDLAYNEITSTVTNNWDRTKDAFSQLGADLTKEGEELAAQYGILATFKAQTDATIVSVAANFDEAGNIKAESKIDQRFNSITTEVSDNKKASDDAFDTLKKYFGFDVRTDTPEDQYVNYATWREQTAKYTGEWAAAFDEGGKLAKYSATVQTAEALERIVVGEGNASSYTGDTLTKIISDNRKAQQDMNSIFSDEIIDSEEMGALIAMMKSLTASYDEAIAAYTAAKEDKNLPSDSTEATALKTASDTLVTKFNDLKTAISDLITYKEGNAYVTKKTIDGQDVYVLKKGAADSINEKFTAFNTALKDLSTAMENAGIKINNSLAAAAAEAKKTIDDYIKNLDDQIKEKYPDLNFLTYTKETATSISQWAAAFDEGGKLAKYSATVQTAESLERIVVGEGNASSYTGDTLTKIISDNRKAQQDMNSIFSDEIIDSEEMGALIAMMKSLTASYDEAIAAYTAAKEDKNLPSDSTEATALKTASDTLVTKFNDLKTAISDLITYKEGNAYVTKKTIDGQDVYVLKKGAADSINEKFTAFNTALKDLSTAMENAGIKINNSLAAAAAEAKKTIDDYIKNLDDQIKEKYPDLNFLTYTKETATSISEWATAFDEGGKLAKYSATVQTAEGLKDVVGDTTKDQFSTMLQKCGIISGTVSSYDSILDGKANAKDLDDKANKSDLKDYEKTVDWASKLSGYATSGQLEALSNNVTAKVQKVAQRGILLTENEWEQGNTTNENPGQQWGDSMKTSSTTKLRTKRLIGVTSLTRITLSSKYRAGFVYFDKNERVTAQGWGGWQSPNSNGIISVGAAGNVAYVIILLKKASEETISPGDVVDAEFSITSDTIVTQGEISLFLTEDDLSNVSIKADNIDFEFSKRWSVKAKGKGEVMYLTTDGDLYLKGNIYGGNITNQLNIDSDDSGAIVIRKYNSSNGRYEGVVKINATEGSKTSTETNVTQLDAGGLLIRWGNEGFKLTNDGQFLRYNPVISGWTNFYAGRFARFINTSKTEVYINSHDDFLVLLNAGHEVYMPTDAPDGKVISIRNVGGTNNIRAGGASYKIRDTAGEHTGTGSGRDLNNDERAELVYHSDNKTWYMNVIGT